MKCVRTYVRIHVCMYITMSVCLYACMCVCVCVCVCMYVCMYVCEATGKESISCISTVILIDKRIEVYENKIMLSRAHDSQKIICPHKTEKWLCM